MNRVFVISNIFIIFLFGLILQFKQEATNILNIISELFIADFGKIYLIGVSFIVFSFIILGASKFGRVRLGGDDAKPEYSRLSWLSMLFSAGMGIGLIYWGVAEPLTHFVNPPRYEALSINAAKDAIQISYFHWGIHAWAIYGLLALLMAYYTYNHKMPLSLRSLLFPIVGKNVNGSLCAGIDIFVIIVTVIGISTSLAMGATQIESGVAYLLPDFSAHINAVHIVIFIAIASSISVLSGISKGISYLSNINIALSFILIVACLIFSREDDFFVSFFGSIFDYVIVQIPTSFYDVTLSSYADNWKGNWTIFYWAWWLIYAPTMGIFLAKISKGRTIRQTIFAILGAGSLGCWVLYLAFGNYGMFLELNGIYAATTDILNGTDGGLVLAKIFSFMPFQWVLVPLMVLLILIFSLTSLVSGAYSLAAVTTLNLPENKEPALWNRIFWSILRPSLTIGFIYLNSLVALKNSAIIASVPCLILIVIMVISMFKMLKEDKVIQSEVIIVKH